MTVELMDCKELLWDAEVPVHTRTHGAIIAVREGEGEITVGPSTYCVRAGDIVLYLPKEDHAYRPESGCFLRATVITFVPAEDLETSLAFARLGFSRYFGAVDECLELCQLIDNQAQSDLEFRRQAAEHLLASLLCILIARIDTEPASNRVKPIDAAMEQLFGQVDARLADVAEDLGVTPEAIRKQFRRYFGQSPMRYFSAYHTQRIAVALRESDATLRELAEQFGFYDEFHLSRVFKRHMGMSPNQYRRSQQGRSE